MFESLKELFSSGINFTTVISILDILITATIIYFILDWIKGTQAAQVLKGVVIILLITELSSWLGFVTINYILRNLMTVGVVALLVMFQPELRRALERLGSTRFRSFFKNIFHNERTNDTKHVVDSILASVDEMSKTKTGALIVIERTTQLKDIMETGTFLDAVVTKPLLLNIFTPKTPLHDGAVIISSSDLKLKAAGCLLPLTQSRNLRQEIGTRHRSAIGISEVSDAFVVVVSEESGVVSCAQNGKLSRFLDSKTLETLLNEVFTTEDNPIKIGVRNNGKEN